MCSFSVWTQKNARLYGKELKMEPPRPKSVPNSNRHLITEVTFQILSILAYKMKIMVSIFTTQQFLGLNHNVKVSQHQRTI